MELQLVELHFPKRPKFDLAATSKRVESLTGHKVDTAGGNESDSSHIIFHTKHVITYADGNKMPAQTVVFALDKDVDVGSYAEDLQQSWSTSNAADLLKDSSHTLAIMEMMARALEPTSRLEVFHAVLQAVIETTQPTALVFKHSQQVVDPASYLQQANDPPLFRVGALNVRFFNIDGGNGEFLMDTRGLQEIGLHDLQCHFRGLEPDDVARLLLNTSAYLVEQGPVIETGNTIQGIGKDSKWVCRFEESLAPPNREVLDIDPGEPFAAGNRSYK